MRKFSSSENILLIEQYLQESFELRYNVLSKKIEVRERKEGAEFRPLTEKMANSIVRRIKLDLEDVTSVNQNVQEFLNSEDICQYDPIRDWLGTLPQWDGQNRMAELFGRIPGISSEQIYWCSIWIRSAVAHWLGMDMLHGNECVPTLIGSQGCGKSTFCHRLLPPHLRVYYLDHFNLANKNDKEMALTNNLLVNLDELDQIRPSQQAQLKQALSKVKVSGRPIYGKEQQERVRYASFVATTNNPHPLQDPTGSRRYLCISIPDGKLIDNESTIDYEQLYAQLMAEVKEKKCRYWFTNEETLQIQQANAQYQQEQDIESMLEACFRLPEEGEEPKVLSAKAIMDVLEKQFPLLKRSHATTIHVGMKLKTQGYKNVKHHGASCYQVIPLVAA
ncbi:MAG: DUF5906 domain-containing protein [Bacteroidaceae bacterium]|nr:DUF5906 domain-containing protein [Bacteroidaceae bacterium]